MELQKLTNLIVAFRDARDWKQFHTPKDIVLSLMIEAAELAQLVQFKTPVQLKRLSRSELGRELADVLYWVLLTAHDLDVDLSKAFKMKMRENERKYPRSKFTGSNRKYSSTSGRRPARKGRATKET